MRGRLNVSSPAGFCWRGRLGGPGEYVAGQASAARHLTGSATSRTSGPTPHPDTPSPAPRSGGAPAAAKATGTTPATPATQAAQAPPTHTANPADPTHEAQVTHPAATHQATDPASRHRDDPRATHPAGHPAGDEPPQPMFYLDDGPKAIALTIDDGPDPCTRRRCWPCWPGTASPRRSP